MCVSETPSSAMLNVKILESQSTKKLSGTTQSNSLSRIDKQQQRPQLHVRLGLYLCDLIYITSIGRRVSLFIRIGIMGILQVLHTLQNAGNVFIRFLNQHRLQQNLGRQQNQGQNQGQQNQGQ